FSLTAHNSHRRIELVVVSGSGVFADDLEAIIRHGAQTFICPRIRTRERTHNPCSVELANDIKIETIKRTLEDKPAAKIFHAGCPVDGHLLNSGIVGLE